MPELPEVETFRKYLESTSLDEKITGISFRDEHVLEKSKSTFRRHLYENKMLQAVRYGKYLLAEISDSYFLVFHFGMTGDLKYYKRQKDMPGHTRFVLNFKNGYNLAFTNTRRLGKLDIVKTIDELVEKHGLGPDALRVSEKEFRKKLSSKKSYVKTALMDQSTIAGIGNIYSDEILFQSEIHPQNKINNLPVEKINLIIDKTRMVLGKSIEAQADYEKLPHDFLIPHREKNGKCPVDGEKLEKIRVGGRSTYFCPSHQEAP